jgi:hypothetical protein
MAGNRGVTTRTGGGSKLSSVHSMTWAGIINNTLEGLQALVTTMTLHAMEMLITVKKKRLG